MRSERPPAAPPTADRRPSPGCYRAGAVAALAVALLALAAVPLTSAAPVAAAPPAAGTWAWGAIDNTTYTSQFAGAFGDAMNLTGSNFSAAGAFVVEGTAIHAELGAFTVINATAPTPSTRAIQAGAVAIANDSGVLAVVGDLPAAGTYAPGAAVPLVNTTSYYLASVLAVTAYVVFANYTVSNTSVALANERVEAETALNTTTVAYHWPNVTADANGSTTVAYTTAAFSELAWVGEVVSITLTPALPIAETPLSVGKSWNATTTANATGWAAYAAEAAWSLNGANSSSANRGVASLNATANLTFGFAVTGAETVLFPNGTSSTGYEVTETEQGASSGAYAFFDGLVVLPTSAPVPAGALRPATPMDALLAGTTATVVPTTAVVGAGGLPVSSTSTVSGSTVSAAPMPPSSANARITATATPTRPSAAPVPPPTSAPSGTPTPPPPPSNTQPPAPSSTPPATAPGSGTTSKAPPPPMGGLGIAILAAAVAAIAAGFLAVALVRERRKP